MSYSKHTWTTGETVTATKLNNMEDGIASAGGCIIVTEDLVNGVRTLDKTVQEIDDAITDGIPVYLSYIYGTLSDYTGFRYLVPIVCVYNYDNTNTIRVVANQPIAIGRVSTYDATFSPAVTIYEATSADAYPTYLIRIKPTNITTV